MCPLPPRSQIFVLFGWRRERSIFTRVCEDKMAENVTVYRHDSCTLSWLSARESCKKCLKSPTFLVQLVLYTVLLRRTLHKTASYLAFLFRQCAFVCLAIRGAIGFQLKILTVGIDITKGLLEFPQKHCDSRKYFSDWLGSHSLQ